MTDDQQRAAQGSRADPTQRQPGVDRGPASPSRPREQRGDEPFDVRIEFVVLDGGAGGALRQRQAAVMRRVLEWVRANSAPMQDAPTDGAAH